MLKKILVKSLLLAVSRCVNGFPVVSMDAFIPSVALTRASQTKPVTSFGAASSSSRYTQYKQAPSTVTRVQGTPAWQTGSAGPAAVGGQVDTTVIWFRDDLRLHDHPALMAAATRGDPIAALVVVPRTPTAFWATCVADLRTGLQQIGGQLYVRPVLCDVPTTVAAFCAESGARHLYFHRGVSANSMREERAVTTVVARECGVSCRGFWTGALRTPDELPFSLDAMPEDCDEFGRLVANVEVGDPFPPPARINPIDDHLSPGDIPLINNITKCSTSSHVTSQNTTVPAAGERVGLERVHDYVRGRSLASVDGAANPAIIDTKIGRLGPFLTSGCVSPRWLWHEVMRNVSKSSMRRFCAEFELVLRDFVTMLTLKHGVHPV